MFDTLAKYRSSLGVSTSWHPGSRPHCERIVLGKDTLGIFYRGFISDRRPGSDNPNIIPGGTSENRNKMTVAGYAALASWPP
jgi:hypothetical protein